MHRGGYTTSSDHFEYLSVPNSATVALGIAGTKNRSKASLSHLELHNRLYAQHHGLKQYSKHIPPSSKGLSKPTTPYASTSRPPTVSPQHYTTGSQQQQNLKDTPTSRLVASGTPPPLQVTPPQLTEENLKLHTKLSKNQPMSYVERISLWRQSLPDKFEDEQDARDSIRRTSAANHKRPTTTTTTSSSMMLPGSSSVRAGLSGSANTVHQLHQGAKKRYDDRTGGNDGGRSTNSALFRPLPSLASLSNLPYATEHGDVSASQSKLGKQTSQSSGVGSGQLSANPASRGKLLCCLKVEIKTGVFRMLPVHENDNAHELSYEFCKTNNLMNSVEALTNHVTLSMSTFSGK
ncbi:hypothetical protein HDU99_002342 [Rhizoclosmatium hyalinum]|nr:hypothetical protein HDU99_002342 [Rhizoclosmatium hyalinum]